METNYLDLLKTVYTKQKLAITDDIGLCIALTKTISKDPDSLGKIKGILGFLFFIAPKHYFYLLYFQVPKKQYLPKFYKVEKEDKKENKVAERMKQVLGWSKREMSFNSKIINNLLKEEKYWKEELGVK